MRYSLVFRRSSFTLTSLAFASATSCAFVILVAGVSFHRRSPLLVLAIEGRGGVNTREKKRCTERSEREWDDLYVCVSHSFGYLPGDEDAKFDGENTGRILEFVIHLLPLPSMVRAPIPGAAKQRRCICGCNTTSIKTMNKHMKEHSRRLNIKTTRLASMTAVFHSRKRGPPAAAVVLIKFFNNL